MAGHSEMSVGMPWTEESAEQVNENSGLSCPGQRKVRSRSPGSSFLRLSAGEITPIIDVLLTIKYRCYKIYVLDKKIEKDKTFSKKYLSI